jgi:hypothetical protein
MPAGWKGGWTLVVDTDDPEGHRASSTHHEGDEVSLQAHSLIVLRHAVDAAAELASGASRT